MTLGKPLLTERLLSSPAFIRDLKSFLSLPAEALLAIAEIGDGPEGFVGRTQARSLSSRFGDSIDKAMRDLRITEHLYDRVTELGLSNAEAIDQITSVASGFEEPIGVDDQRAKAIEAVLSYKRPYEISKGTVRALEDVPHFTGVSGSWIVKPIRTREGEIIKVPVMTLSITWHESSSDHKQAFICMSEEDWNDFNAEIKILADSRKDIEEML